MHREQVINTNPDILSGNVVFTGTRVPIQTLIDYLKAGDKLDDFLDGFPSVSREQAQTLLEIAIDSLLYKELGAANFVRFIQQINSGYGNYVEDRQQWQKDYSVDKILAEMEK